MEGRHCTRRSRAESAFRPTLDALLQKRDQSRSRHSRKVALCARVDLKRHDIQDSGRSECTMEGNEGVSGEIESKVIVDGV